MATLLGGLLAFRFSGVALGKRSSQAGAAVATDLSKKPSRLSAANTARALAAGFFIGAALANIPTARLELERRQQEQALDALAQRFSARGGSIGIQNRKLTTLNAWPAMTDAELGQFDLSAVHTLSLADSHVTDAVLNRLSHLVLWSLDLSRTQISEQALAKCDISHVVQLSLSTPQFTGECFASWHPVVRELNLSHSGVSDATLAYLPRQPLERLDLSHTAVTDAGLLQTIGKLSLESLNVAHTSITADGILATKITRNLAIAPSQFSPAECLRLESNGVTVQVEE